MSNHKLAILDNIFAHAKSSSWYNEPAEFLWIPYANQQMVVMTDNHVFQVDHVPAEKKIAWLLESPLVTPKSYDFVAQNHTKFYKIFTFDLKLLQTLNNAELLPIGGCWIEEQNRVVFFKTKLLSIIASPKQNLIGHSLRHKIIDKFPFIHAYGKTYNQITNKIEALQDYKFSVVIENCKTDYYFTEKLIDCFVTGTIPIYWGCPSINKFFDIDGILTFNDIEEFFKIVTCLDLNAEYEKRLKAIQNNFEISKKYLIADDTLYNKLNLC